MPRTKAGRLSWHTNFSQNIGPIAERLGYPASRTEKVVANEAILAKATSIQAVVDNYADKVLSFVNTAMEPNPTNPTAPIVFPVLKGLPDAPASTTGNILGDAIRLADEIHFHPDATDTDFKALRLLLPGESDIDTGQKQEEKAVRLHNYPRMKGEMVNNMVVIKFTRGRGFGGLNILLQVDREGRGEFKNLTITNNNEFREAVTLPEGVKAGVFTYQAIFMNGTEEASDWSPPLLIPVRASISVAI